MYCEFDKVGNWKQVLKFGKKHLHVIVLVTGLWSPGSNC